MQIDLMVCSRTRPPELSDESRIRNSLLMPDFDQYYKMNTIDDAKIDNGHRLIFIGDIHGSFAPLQYVRACQVRLFAQSLTIRRLLTNIQYNMDKDKIIHVGDLIAKGERNLEVLDWMIEFEVQGVRGNHDQPVSLKITRPDL